MNEFGPWGIGIDGANRDPAAQMSYFNFGAGCSEVEVDLLTGEHVVRQTDIVYVHLRSPLTKPEQPLHVCATDVPPSLQCCKLWRNCLNVPGL